MPISHKHKIVFVHIPKTGGATIEKTLKIFGSDNNGSLKPNYDILYGISGNRILQHLKINEINELTENKFQEYKLFSFVRNPYDRIVSEFLWRSQIYGTRKISFKEFLLEDAIPRKKGINKFLKNFYKDESLIPNLDIHYESQNSFLKVDNEYYVKNIGKFEKIETDFKTFTNKNLLNYKIHQSKSNYLYYLYKKFFPKFLTKYSYKKYYDNETYDLITKNYSEDIKIFNYKF